MSGAGETPRGATGRARDRTEGEALRRLNRTLRALSSSSQAMLRASDERSYLNDVCRIVVEDCGHAMVWIGFAEEDADRTVRPVAHAGFEAGYLDGLRVTWADTERGRGPTGAAIRTGRVCVCSDMLTDPRFAPWREEAVRRGYASSMALPLLAAGRAFGSITIYSREADPFSEDEQKLLEELANDLAYGITALRDRAARVHAEEALRRSEQRVRQKLESILSPEGDVAELALADLLDVAAVQALMEDFFAIARIPMAVIDLAGEVLVGVGWQDICTRFHRVHPETRRHCLESDTELSAGVPPGEFRSYRCKNGMRDMVTPLVVGGRHVGNVFSGQFFLDDEPPDREAFRAQAVRHGFDERAYLDALEAVPRLTRAEVAAGMSFLTKLADMLSRLGRSNVSLARAVAEREALTSSLRAINQRLEETDRKRSDFLALLSHELRNPLAPIRNSVEILKRTAPAGEQARRARDVIDRQALHLTRLVDDLLEVTRIARGKIELRKARIDLCELARATAEDHRSVVEGRGLSLAVDVSSTPCWVDGDAVRLAQIIGNLLQNSAKFSDHGSICLEVAPDGDSVVLRVRDTGRGIDPALLPRLFEPFVQGPHDTARTAGGLGLGLALVKGLAEQHGGSVLVSSPGSGMGAEFVVRLPAPRT
jgi:signal transduction histidine kinase/putative methionine-R-sulfoxide reductase with GAF domain